MPVGFKERVKDDDGKQRPTRYYSSKQEKSVAKIVKGY